MSADPTARRKAYKLKTPVTRDSFLTWDLNHKSFCRQNVEWQKFLPGGTNSTWKRYDEDDTHGITIYETQMRVINGRQERVPTQHTDETATNKARAALQEFLVVLGTYAPENFMHTIVNESTSYNWVLEKIKTTFNLNTRGLGFLSAGDIKFDIGDDGQTYQQVYQAIKEFYCSSLLKKGDKHEGQELDKNEPLTPLCKNFIVEKWLDTINPELKNHIRNTRGSLFTEERPSLSDNQLQLCEQMPTLLQELENNPSPSLNRTSMAPAPTTVLGTDPTTINRTGFYSQPRRNNFPLNRRPQQNLARPNQYNASRNNPMVSSCPPDTCYRCYEAGRRGPATKTHMAAQCNLPRRGGGGRGGPQQMRVFLMPTYNGNFQDQLPAQIQEIHLDQGLLQQDHPDQQWDQQEVYGNDQEDGYYYENDNFYENKDLYQYYGLPTYSRAEQSHHLPPPTINIIPTRPIQKFTFLCKNRQAVLAVDSGCEADCMTETEAKRLKLKILPLEQHDRTPNQADGVTPLNVIGAAIATFYRNDIQTHWHGYVVKHLSQPILCGLPFIETNNITQNISRKTMTIGTRVIMEDPPLSPGSPFPFNVSQIENPFYIQEIELNNLTNLHSLIEIGNEVSQNIKQRLHSIHAYHKRVFDGDLSEGYNGASGNHEVDFDFNNNLPPSPHKGSVPNYYKHEDSLVLQTKIEELEKQNIVAKVSDLGFNLKYASPCMIRKKNSAKQMSKEEYGKLSVEEKAKLNRFVICLNKLSSHINKKPAAVTKPEETINAVSSYEFIITADLQDSFNQRKIKKSKLPFMGFHSPFGDNYVLLRSPQGLINQSEELEMLVKIVLKEGVQKGYVRIHADNIYVMGHTPTETVDRWERVLEDLEANNLKLSPKKTACFPNKLDLLGWTKQGKFLVPDVHRQNTLLTCKRPENIQMLRSFLGTFHTFHKCHKNHNVILSPLTKLLSKNPSSNQKIDWTPELNKAFEEAQAAARNLDKLYTPKPSDQLVVTSDYAEKGSNMTAGISATLWAVVENKWHVVARMSAEIEPQQRNLHPCDGEATAVYVAAKTPTFRIPIKAALKKTQALVDSKPLMEAAKLISQGKFSTSKIINNVLSSISDLNLEFHHLSGKLYKNCPDDFGSRSPIACPDPSSCKLHAFIRECTGFAMSRVSISVSLEQEGAIIGHIKKQDNTVLKDILTGKAALPLSNRRAFAFLQSRDKDLVRVRELLLAGQKPSDKRDTRSVKQFFRSDRSTTIARDGVIVVIKRNKQTMVTRELVVVPDSMSMGLLYSLHLNLNHPSSEQLLKATDTRFFISDVANKCKTITKECTPCTSIKSIPAEVYEYKQNLVPDHPGKSFTVDVMKECNKLVLIAADNFSGFITTTFVDSEKEVDLKDGIIKTVTPFMASSVCRIRVDRAPGFAKLSNKAATLAELGIDMELGECKNKNALAIVDQKIKELRLAIKKISPSHTVLNQMTLSKATTTVNETIRHHTLSSKEIQFSRDLASSRNLQLNDEAIQQEIEKNRTKKNPDSAKAKSTFNKPASRAEAEQGQLVFLKNEGSKNQRRDLYLVIDTDPEADMVTICKIRNALSNNAASMVPQDPRFRYRVHQTNLILAPNQPPPPTNHDVFYTAEEEIHDVPQQTNTRPHHANSPHPTLKTKGKPASNDSEPEIWFETINQTEDPPETVTTDPNHQEENSPSTDDDVRSNDEQEKYRSDESNNQQLQLPDEEHNHQEGPHDSDQDHVIDQQDLNQQPAIPLHLDRPQFPTRGKFIKFKRQVGSQIDSDLFIPTDSYLFAKITHKFNKPDQFGRLYFNILRADNSKHGLFLARGDIGPNDLIWDIIKEEEFQQHQQHMVQIDGAMTTPESTTTSSSPELPQALQMVSCPSPEWDHSPERLMEDNAFLWEEEPLRALTVQDILSGQKQDQQSSEKDVKLDSPLGTFRRHLVIRKKRKANSGYAANIVPHPTDIRSVQMSKANNLNNILNPNIPVVPELVQLDKSQQLHHVLPVVVHDQSHARSQEQRDGATCQDEIPTTI